MKVHAHEDSDVAKEALLHVPNDSDDVAEKAMLHLMVKNCSLMKKTNVLKMKMQNCSDELDIES